MRIVSLLPSATEIVCALGLRDALVGRSHECDHPGGVETLPAVSLARIDSEALSSAEIDAEVRGSLDRGEQLYRVDERLLAELRPDLVITQTLCRVCAVEGDGVRSALRVRAVEAEVMELEPGTVDQVLQSIELVGRAARRGRARARAGGRAARAPGPGRRGRGRRRRAAADVRGRVARATVRRRPLGARDGRARRRRRDPRPHRPAVVHHLLGRGAGSAGRRWRSWRRAASTSSGRWPRPPPRRPPPSSPARRRRATGASTRSTRPRTTPARARGSSTASS